MTLKATPLHLMSDASGRLKIQVCILFLHELTYSAHNLLYGSGWVINFSLMATNFWFNNVIWT